MSWMMKVMTRRGRVIWLRWPVVTERHALKAAKAAKAVARARSQRSVIEVNRRGEVIFGHGE